MTQDRSTSRAAVLTRPNDLKLNEFPLPTIGPDDGLLQVEMAGICHTDVELYRGTVTYALPIVLGHEIVGRIAEIGDTAARRWNLQVGDRVAVEGLIRCGYCWFCITGRYKHCTERMAYGTFTPSTTPPGLWGSFADYLYLAPGSLPHRVPEGMSPATATVATVALSNAVDWTLLRGGVTAGDTVVVKGPGPIGLCCAAVARAAGASLVIVVGMTRDLHRMRMAARFGADVTIDAEAESAVERVMGLTAGKGADLVVDATGSGASVRESLQMVSPGGAVINGGVTGDGVRTDVPLDALLYNETRLQGVFTFDAHGIRRALQIADRGQFPFEELVTHRFALERAEDGLLAAEVRSVEGQEVMKAAITP